MPLRSCLLLSALLLAPSPTHSQELERASVGIALGGGAARGIAHIGFLEWLEEHRIPVDFVAGTSMGGLVGGAYASGMSTAELRALMRDMDWDLVFLSDSPFQYKNFRRKGDARLYPGQIELGLKGGFRFPTGLNAGQQIELALDRIAAPYDGLESFDELPIPFRCVAVDLRSREEIVLGSGSLSRAMRATMAIPGFFTPVEMDHRLLVDGGALNNVPANVTKEMGADVVIAVNVGSASEESAAPENMFEVLGQTVDVMMTAGVDRVLESADVVVTPDLGELTGMDWRRSDELADRGYAAAEAMNAELLAYAVDEVSYRAWSERRNQRRRDASQVLQFVRIEGVSDELAARIQSHVEDELVGKRFDSVTVERQVLLMTGSDRFSVVRYRLEETSTGTGLVIHAEAKKYAPPFLFPAVDLQNRDSNNFALNLRARLVFLDTLVPGSEIRIDAGVGTRLHAAAELYKNIGRSPIFFAPRIYTARRSQNVFDDQNRLLAEYRDTTAGIGIDVGLDLGPRSQLRFGYDLVDVELRRRIGAPFLPEAQGDNRLLSLRWTFDGQTSPLIPTRGVYVRTEIARYFETPSLFVDQFELQGPENFYQAEALFSAFRSTAGDHRLFIAGGAGSSFGDDAGYNEFELGGMLRLGAFFQGELTGNNYVLGQGGALIRVLRLPDVVGGNGYIGGWLETGSAFDEWDDAHIEWQFSGGFVLETILGPVFLGGSVSFNDGSSRFYVNIGPFLLQQAETWR